MPLRTVIDTGVFLAQMNPDPTGGRLWFEMRAGNVVPLLSAETLDELERKLSEPRFRLSETDAAAIIAEYLSMGIYVTDVPDLGGGGCRDPDDRAFVNLALFADCDAIVSHDGDLLDLNGSLSFPVLRVSEFLALLRSSL